MPIRGQLRIADLRQELAQRNKLLEAAQAKLTLELNLARKVQLGLMPRPPKTWGIHSPGRALRLGQLAGGRRLRFYPA